MMLGEEKMFPRTCRLTGVNVFLIWKLAYLTYLHIVNIEPSILFISVHRVCSMGLIFSSFWIRVDMQMFPILQHTWNVQTLIKPLHDFLHRNILANIFCFEIVIHMMNQAKINLKCSISYLKECMHTYIHTYEYVQASSQQKAVERFGWPLCLREVFICSRLQSEHPQPPKKVSSA